MKAWKSCARFAERAREFSPRVDALVCGAGSLLAEDALPLFFQLLPVPHAQPLLGEHGALFQFKVFHRAGEPCLRCGQMIEKTMISSRPFYWCPNCQR